MGKGNAVIKTYIGKVEYFADLFNYYLFCDMAIIKAEDLEPTDGESDIIIENKDDKLVPVITLVFYYGLEEWDASKDLYGMLELNEYLRDSVLFQSFIPNYKINLIDVEHMDNLEKLHTDLQIVLGMLQFRSNTEKLKEYILEHEDYFSSVDKDTYHAIAELLEMNVSAVKSLSNQ